MKKTICILLSLMFVVTGLVGLGMTSSAVYKVGSTYTFGSYPQTNVTESLGSKLNALGGTWTSYNYGTTSDGKKQLMLYKDVNYNGAKYRGVTINGNRGSCYVYKEYLAAGNVYWFKWEPLKWRVLDPSTGFLLCESIIDSQPFRKELNSDYANSDIRIWLNQTFLNTAFSSTEKAAIQTTTLDNTSALSSLYDASTTNDKIFLLSYTEATNSAYGFRSEDFDTTDTDFNRLKEGSDYAKCQGLWYCYDEYSLYENFSYWWLRTPYSPIYACGVEYDSRVFTNELVNYTNFGVCPAIKIGNLNGSVTLQSIAIKTLPAQTVYTIGDAFDDSGLTLTATYSDGSTEVVKSGFTCTGFDSATAGTKTITVTYQGKTTTFTVTVNPVSTAQLTDISVKTKPTKTVYVVGESFRPTGLTLTATYSDGSTKTIKSGFICTGFNSSTPGIVTIKVTYEGKSATFTVTVRSASSTLTGITVKTMPSKTVYTYRNDEELNLAGLEVEATYSDGSTIPVDLSDCTITGYSAKPAGEKTITVEYEGQTAQFKVTVKLVWWQWLIRIFLLGFIWY